jgi:hypothetical protein
MSRFRKLLVCSENNDYPVLAEFSRTVSIRYNLIKVHTNLVPFRHGQHFRPNTIRQPQNSVPATEHPHDAPRFLPRLIPLRFRCIGVLNALRVSIPYGVSSVHSSLFRAMTTRFFRPQKAVLYCLRVL